MLDYMVTFSWRKEVHITVSIFYLFSLESNIESKKYIKFLTSKSFFHILIAEKIEEILHLTLL